MSLSRRGLLLSAASSLALVGCSGTAAPSASTPAAGASSASGGGKAVTLGLTYIPNIQFSPFYVAKEQGFYNLGSGVELRHHGEQEGLFTALAAGQEHIVAAGADEMLQARAEGMELVTIAQYYRTYPVVAIVKDASPIKAAADLKGKRIGVPGRYGETWFGLLVLLKNAGLALSDVTVTEIGYTQQAALATDKVDAVMGYVNNDVVNFGSAGIPVRTIALTATQVPLIGVSLVTTQKFLDAQGPLAKQIVDATTRAFNAVVKDPAGAVTASAAHIATLKTDAAARSAAAATLEATIKLWQDASGTVTPTIDEQQFAAMTTFMGEQGLLKQPVKASEAMSNAYHS